MDGGNNTRGAALDADAGYGDARNQVDRRVAVRPFDDDGPRSVRSVAWVDEMAGRVDGEPRRPRGRSLGARSASRKGTRMAGVVVQAAAVALVWTVNDVTSHGIWRYYESDRSTTVSAPCIARQYRLVLGKEKFICS